MRSFQAGMLKVEIYRNRAELGKAAAARIASAFGGDVKAAIFAAAPSQSETLAALAETRGIAWERITAYHLDEYAGARPDSPHSFRRFLREHLFSKVPVARFEGLCGEAADLEAEAARYAGLLAQGAPAVGLIGIGENGHIAFNDPPDSRFDDPALVRVARLTQTCRQQQVHDGAFATLADVPHAALTVSIPGIMRVPKLFVMVPGARKAEAVQRTVEGPVSELCPGSILREHPDATLFLDWDAASRLRE
jgi:glucosamine-6-phosphate deaminase